MGFIDKLLGRKPPRAAASLGRNQLCWCGSGKKYKHCHYEEDRKHFSANLNANCHGPT